MTAALIAEPGEGREGRQAARALRGPCPDCRIRYDRARPRLAGQALTRRLSDFRAGWVPSDCPVWAGQRRVVP